MLAALAQRRPSRAQLVLWQAAWDQFLHDEMDAIQEPNPDLRRDLALDRTIRALGPRPRAPLTLAEREALATHAAVDAILVNASRPRRFGQDDHLNRVRSRKLIDPENDDWGD